MKKLMENALISRGLTKEKIAAYNRYFQSHGFSEEQVNKFWKNYIRLHSKA